MAKWLGSCKTMKFFNVDIFFLIVELMVWLGLENLRLICTEFEVFVSLLAFFLMWFCLFLGKIIFSKVCGAIV